MQFESIKHVKPLDIAMGDRILNPTAKNIEAMMKSLDRLGQLTPIAVKPVTHNTYRLVAGATRLEAAIKLGWEKIRVEVVTATEVEFELHEIVENLDRRDLTKEQRKMLRERKCDAERRMLEQVEASKIGAGRGHKGGVREAARQTGMSLGTAQRRAKMTQNTQSGSFSHQDSSKTERKNLKIGLAISRSERDFLDELQEKKKFPTLSDTIRAIIRGDAPSQREWTAEKKQHLGTEDQMMH